MKLQHIPLLIIGILFNCNSKTKSTPKLIKSKIDTSITSEKNLQTPITKAFVLGKFNYKTDSTFIKVKSEHSTKQLYLKKECYMAFIDMYTAAKADSIDLIIQSGTRNFKEQKAIWERKWKLYNSISPIERAKKILEYSAMPSTSRHHWGTDLDLNNLNNSYFESGEGKKTYNWLTKNANRYGFYQVYTSKNNGRSGYNEEKWHWSYLPLASQYLQFYNHKINIEDITGFEGSNYAKELQSIETFVNGIASKAKHYKQ